MGIRDMITQSRAFFASFLCEFGSLPLKKILGQIRGVSFCCFGGYPGIDPFTWHHGWIIVETPGGPFDL